MKEHVVVVLEELIVVDEVVVVAKVAVVDEVAVEDGGIDEMSNTNKAIFSA